MTRRELPGPTEVESQSVEKQSLYPDGSDSVSQRSTLPSYDDAMGGYKKMGDDHTPPDFHNLVDLGWQDEEQSTMTSRDDRTSCTSPSTQQPSAWKGRLRSQLLFMLVIFVVYITTVRLVFWRHGLRDHTPTSEPGIESIWPPAREIRIHQIFGAIHGTYPLYDLLDLSTVTGAIDVTIQPQPGNKMAIVKINSNTGAVHIRFAKPAAPTSDGQGKNEKGVYERVYKTQISTTTGQIHGEVWHGGHGGETIVSASTGMLDVRVLPISDEISTIETSTQTGMSKVVVESAMHGSTLRRLTAVHKSTVTGMLDVKYPREWVGKVHVWCEGTGQVEVKGDGLNLQGGGTDVYAWRGEDALEKGKTVEVVSEGTGMVRFQA